MDVSDLQVADLFCFVLFCMWAQWRRLKPCSSYCSVLDHDVVLVLRPEVSLLLLCCQDVFHLPHHAVYCSVRSRRMFKRWFIFALWVFLFAHIKHITRESRLWPILNLVTCRFLCPVSLPSVQSLLSSCAGTLPTLEMSWRQILKR